MKIYFSLLFISVPTLVQLLKDIDSTEEIVEYVQPYIGSIIKAKEFANDFIAKRKQLANAEVIYYIDIVKPKLLNYSCLILAGIR